MRAHDVLAEAVKLRREQQGLTQAELAEALADHGVTMHPTTVVRLEKTERGVRVDELLALAAALGVTPADLLAPPGLRTLTLGERELDSAQVLAWFAGDVDALDRFSVDLSEIRDEIRNHQILSDLAEEIDFVHHAVNQGDRPAVIYAVARAHNALAALTDRTMTEDQIREIQQRYGLGGAS